MATRCRRNHSRPTPKKQDPQKTKRRPTYSWNLVKASYLCSAVPASLLWFMRGWGGIPFGGLITLVILGCILVWLSGQFKEENARVRNVTMLAGVGLCMAGIPVFLVGYSAGLIVHVLLGLAALARVSGLPLLKPVLGTRAPAVHPFVTRHIIHPDYGLRSWLGACMRGAA